MSDSAIPAGDWVKGRVRREQIDEFITLPFHIKVARLFHWDLLRPLSLFLHRDRDCLWKHVLSVPPKLSLAFPFLRVLGHHCWPTSPIPAKPPNTEPVKREETRFRHICAEERERLEKKVKKAFLWIKDKTVKWCSSYALIMKKTFLQHCVKCTKHYTEMLIKVYYSNSQNYSFRNSMFCLGHVCMQQSITPLDATPVVV